MHIHLTGLNQKTAPVSIREMVSFSNAELPAALPVLTERVGEAVLLSTCNRTEVYTVGEDLERASVEIRAFLSDRRGVDAAELSPHLYDKTDGDAARHLFQVAAGLDSMIIGESEVLGQVRGALSTAAEHKTVGGPGSRLFHAAIRAGRKVREETDVGRNALSISYAAVRLAQQVLGSLDGRRVLLVGAGEAGRLVARALRTTGVAELAIANRTLERAQELAETLNGQAVPLDEIGSHLAVADIIIAATEAPEYVLTADAIASATQSGRRSIFLFDLSVPRNVDPTAGEIEGVSLYNIDDMSAIAEENLKGRERAAADAEQIVDAEVARFMSWWDSLEAEPVVKALRNRADRIRERELARALQRLNGLSPDDLEVVDAMTRSIVNRLLHEPTTALKRNTNETQLQAIRDLFNLHDDLS